MKLIAKFLTVFLLFQLSTSNLLGQRPENYEPVTHDKQRPENYYRYLHEKRFPHKDSTKFFVGYDVLKGIIDESSLTFGYNITQHSFVTFSFGYTYDNISLKSLFCGLSPSQDEKPFLSYQGPTFRASYGYRLISYFYVGFDFYRKYLHYNNQTFFDSEGDWGDRTFTRSETADVLGWHINLGFMLNFSKFIYFNPSISLGKSYKSRTYTTTSSTNHQSYNLPLGTFSKELEYCSFMSCLNFGVKF